MRPTKAVDIMIEKLEQFGIWLVVIIGLGVAILDLVGLLGEVPWLIQRPRLSLRLAAIPHANAIDPLCGPV